MCNSENLANWIIRDKLVFTVPEKLRQVAYYLEEKN